MELPDWNWKTVWEMILCVLVTFHLISEYFHYLWEFFSGRKNNKLLEDIRNHHYECTNDTKLNRILEILENDDLSKDPQ